MILPYQLENDPETGLYSFVTSNNVKYICRFKEKTNQLSPLLGVYDLEIYDFDFYPETKNTEKIKNDPAICATICDLFTQFFSSNRRVLVYVCDSSDSRHKGRNSLFKSWHNKFVSHVLMRIAVEIKIDDEATTYGCALVTHDFPHMDILKSELIDKVDGIMMEKYGYEV